MKHYLLICKNIFALVSGLSIEIKLVKDYSKGNLTAGELEKTIKGMVYPDRFCGIAFRMNRDVACTFGL